MIDSATMILDCKESFTSEEPALFLAQNHPSIRISFLFQKSDCLRVLERPFMNWVRFAERFGSSNSPHGHCGRGLLRSLWPDSLRQVSQALRRGAWRYSDGWHRCLERDRSCLGDQLDGAR